MADGESERAMPATPAAPLTLAEGLPRRLLDLLFPPRCVHCQTTGAPLCGACAALIHAPPAPRCSRCDCPLLGASGPRCRACVALERAPTPPALARIIVAAEYDGPVASAIRALKFRGQRRLAGPLAALLDGAMRRAEPRADLIIPMPLHAERLRRRGYNQAALLARPLARALGVPLRDDALLRTRASRPQTRLHASERRANVAGAFALAPGVGATLAGKRIVLLDDVTTTGATLESAAEALLAAHPAAIIGLAVARPDHGTDGDTGGRA
ncbi:MAG TPA: ComF family protein [Ktedonobacterales bacterium]